jgi:hypothetical protein
MLAIEFWDMRGNVDTLTVMSITFNLPAPLFATISTIWEW